MPAQGRDQQVDVVIVGAGILGIYQLYRARDPLRSRRITATSACALQVDFLLNPGGRPKLDEFMARAAESGYQGFLA